MEKVCEIRAGLTCINEEEEEEEEEEKENF
jgi:hypothetical protein